MHRSAALFALLTTMVLGAGWLACFGEDPELTSSRDDIRAGENGGACLEAGTCKDGLACVDGVCGSDRDGVDSGSRADQSAPDDGSTTGDADSGSACGAVLLPVNAAGVLCPRNGTTTACSGQESCCLEQSAGSPCIGTAVGCGGTIWNCASQYDCPANQHCCLDGPGGTAMARDTCGASWTFQGPRGTQCRGSCGTNEHELCDQAESNSGCPDAGKCVRARATLAATDVLFNACGE